MFFPKKTSASTRDCSAETDRLKNEIETADAIVIGAGAGLSTAAGFTYSGERFENYFSDFIEKYNFRDMYSGGFYPFETLEAEFDKHRLFYTQGDYGLFQCSEPCCQKTYDNEDIIRKMYAEQENMLIPTELVPRCPKCGRPMTMNLRADETFVQDEGWYRAAERYEEFLRRHENLHILFLELGVGYNTPAIIKYPFWQMTAKNPKAVYACLNFGEAFCPEQIRPQAICMDADIGTIFKR